MIAEILLARFGLARARYEPRDTAVSLMMSLGRNFTAMITAGNIAAATLWACSHRLNTIPVSAVWTWVAMFFLEDLTYYWFHRLSHERRFWWAAHVNQHTSQPYNLSTALRQTCAGGLAGTWVMRLPLAFVGFSPATIATLQGISLVYQFWIQTEALGKLPAPIEAVFNNPSHHRVRHARNPRYLDRNYAGVLIIWDILFATFEPERADEPCRFGVVKSLGDFNLLRAAFHEWIAIGHDIR